MKNIINKFTFFVALSFVFISCGNLVTSENDDSIPQGKGKICISTNLDSQSRSVLPIAITENTEGLTWELEGTCEGKTYSKIWNDTTSEDGVITTAYNKMKSDNDLLLDVGTWTFTLKVKNNSGYVLFATKEVSINTGENNLSFNMKEATSSDIANGETVANGSIEFTLKFPKDVIDNVVATLYNHENNEKVESATNFSIDSTTTDNYSSVKYSYQDSTGATSTLAPGYYRLHIDLRQNTGDATASNYQKINTYTCLVRVAPGLCSKGEYTLNSLAKLYTITYECNQGTFGTEPITTSYNEYTSFELPTPTLYGHTFDGWYTDANCTDAVNASTFKISSDTILYAKWTKNYDFQLSKQDGGTVAGDYKLVDGSGCVTITDNNTNVSVWNYYLKSNDINFQPNSNYKITVEMKTEDSDSVVAIQAANSDMFFTVGKEWTPCTMETGFIEKQLDSTRNAITFGIGLSQKTYFRNLVIEEISDDGLPTLVFDITTEGINQYLNTQNKAEKIIDVEKVTLADNKPVYNITINTPLTNGNSVQYVKLHLRDYAKDVGVNNVSFTVTNTGNNPFATSFMADTASNNSMAWNNVRTEVGEDGFNTCNIDFPNYTENDELTVDVITGSGNAYSNHPVEFTISEFEVTNIESPATPFENKIFAIKTGDTWTQSKEVEVSIPADGSIKFDVGMFSSWENNNNNNMPSFEDVTRFLYTGNISDGLTYSTGTDDSGNPTYTVTNNSDSTKIVKIALNDNYEVVIEDVSSIVTTWKGLKSRITELSISNLVIKNDLTVTETITISRKVMITADKNVKISRGASCGFFVINTGSLELGSDNCTIILDGGNTTDYATTKGPLIWQYSDGQGVTLTNCILQNNTLDDSSSTYEQGAAIKTEQPFTMNNCSISNCHGSEGGAVYTFDNGSFTMNGGSISGCTATENGNAVYIGGGNLTLSGDAEITSDNDVYLAYGKTVTVAADLSKEFVATITLSSYDVDRQVITAADNNVILSEQVGKFTISSEGYYIDENGMLGKESEVASWGALSSTLLDSSVTRILLTENLTATTTINISNEVEILATKDVTITRDSSFTGAFFNNTSTLTLGDGTNTITLDGGKNSNINAQAPLIQSGADGACLTLNNCNLQNNKNVSTTVKGGAISISGGTFTMNGGIIGTEITEEGESKQSWEYAADESKFSNYAAAGGGGIYVADGTVEIKNAKVSYNSVPDDSSKLCHGGGILMEKGNLTLEDTEVSYNRGFLGGGVRCYGWDTQNAGTLTLKHATIKGNAGKYVNHNNNYGGGLVVQYFELICDDLTEASIIEENYSANGGAVFLEKTTSTLNNITIQNNTRASGEHNYGTEMLLYNQANISIGSSNVTIVSSDADDDKGIYFSANMSNSNTLKLFGDVKLDTPIYLASGEKITIGKLTADNVATITPEDYTVGTQVLVAEDGVNLSEQVGKFTIASEGYYIDKNGMLGKESEVTSWELLSSTLSDSSVTRILLTGNLTATTTINVSTEVEILATKDVTITRDSSFTGAFFNNTSTLTLGDGTNKITLDGGKINAQAPLIQSGGEGASLTLNNCNLQNNKNVSTTVKGGAISISGGTFTMNGGVIGKEIEEGTEGAKQSWEDAATEDKHSNYAYAGGGGIYAVDGTVTIKDAKVSYNYVPDDDSYDNPYNTPLKSGGGILMEKGNLTLENTEVSYNRGYQGGGVRCYKDGTENVGTLTLKNATIKGNAGKHYAWSNFGGALAIRNFNVICAEASIIEENYSADGGAVFLEGTTSTLENITIQNNSFNENGYRNGSEMLLYSPATILIGSSDVTIKSSNENEDRGIYLPKATDINLNLFGDVKLDTPIYLASGEKITIGELTADNVATITLAEDYTVGTQVLVAKDGVKLADQVGKFTLKNTDYKISDDGRVVQNSGGGGSTISYAVGEEYKDSSGNVVGYVFEVNENYIKIASSTTMTSDDEVGFQWCSATNIDSSLRSITDGLTMKQTILSLSNSSQYELFNALQDDWYVPTMDEFQTMVNTLVDKIDFDYSTFWTCTFYNNQNIYYYSYGDFENQRFDEFCDCIPVKKITF